MSTLLCKFYRIKTRIFIRIFIWHCCVSMLIRNVNWTADPCRNRERRLILFLPKELRSNALPVHTQLLSELNFRLTTRDRLIVIVGRGEGMRSCPLRNSSMHECSTWYRVHRDKKRVEFIIRNGNPDTVSIRFTYYSYRKRRKVTYLDKTVNEKAIKFLLTEQKT